MTKFKLKGLKWKVMKLRGWVLHFCLTVSTKVKKNDRFKFVGYYNSISNNEIVKILNLLYDY